MRILLHDSHWSPDRAPGWSGAPGEAAFIHDELNPRIVARLGQVGIEVVRVAGDMLDRPEYHQDYDAFVAPHYESDTHAHASGMFWGRAAASLSAARDDLLGEAMWRHLRQISEAPPERFNWMTANVTAYYAFGYTTAKTPGVLIELGVGAPVCNGHGFPTAPDHAWLRAHVDELANAIAAGVAEFGGVGEVTVDPKFAVLGRGGVTIAQMRSWLTGRNPAAPTEIPQLYAELAAAAGVRTEMAFAQACKETNFWRFTGTAKIEWNNPAGLGVTGAPDVGNRFVTWEQGIRAHLGHLLWYFGEHMPAFCDRDQRHFGDHKRLANDARQMNGKWAVPGTTYGETIADMARELAAVQVARVPTTLEEILPAIWLQRLALGWNPWDGTKIRDDAKPLPTYARSDPNWRDPFV